MTSRVAVLSTGIPDPTQGGSGIFNYYVVRELLDHGYAVDAYFRVGDNFRQQHTVGTYLEELVNRGLNVEFVTDDRPLSRGKVGFSLLRSAHQISLCESVVQRILAHGPKYSAFIAHDLGWIIALAGKCEPVVGIMGDPLHARLLHGMSVELFRPATWRRYLQARSVASKGVFHEIGRLLNDKVIFGAFSPHHAKEFRDNGVECRHFRWFSPEVAWGQRMLSEPRKEPLVLLHVGTLASTASHVMIRYWQDCLLPKLASLPFSVEIRFVGRTERTFDYPSSNLMMRFLGHEGDLHDEFARCDLFFTPMKYPVGTRTRILTAMSYGVPTLADSSASLGLPELEDGLHIFFGDTPEDIKRILTRIRLQPETAAQVGHNARQLWNAEFNPVTNVAAILAAAGL